MIKTTKIKTPAGYQTIHYFEGTHFEVDGNPARIIASERTGREAEDVKHTIRKHNGEVVEVHMATLVKLYKEGRLR